VNTQALSDEAARALLEETGHAHRLPATDPIRYGVEGIVDRIVGEFG
jgi:uncharacterized NAD-dependent epimerase/dehydratase family protein